MIERGKCKHFNGVQNKTCRAGVDYRELTGGTMRLPCLGNRPDTRPCEKYEEPTDEEIAADRAQIDARMEELRREGELLRPLIARIREDHGWGGKKTRHLSGSGVDDCPCCQGGKVRWSIAGYNGHIHMRCSTPGCVAFMQ